MNNHKQMLFWVIFMQKDINSKRVHILLSTTVSIWNQKRFSFSALLWFTLGANRNDLGNYPNILPSWVKTSAHE